jgi:hypothetical protein
MKLNESGGWSQLIEQGCNKPGLNFSLKPMGLVADGGGGKSMAEGLTIEPKLSESPVRSSTVSLCVSTPLLLASYFNSLLGF